MLGGILYVTDHKTLIANNVAGGIWRSTNPSADLEGVYPPAFVKENSGLTANVSWGYATLALSPYTFFLKAAPGPNVAYYNCLVAMADTLGSPVTLTGPDADAKGEGIKRNTTDLTMTLVLSWQAASGATQYTWEVANDTEFNSIVATSTTAGQQAQATLLLPGRTYYWRVRVTAPFVSPWSEARSVSVGSAVEFGLTSPEVGAMDIPLKPTFVWTEFEGAIGYEIMVAEDPTFAIIEWSRNVDSTFYKAEEALAYDTTYYWRVRGVTGSGITRQVKTRLLSSF